MKVYGDGAKIQKEMGKSQFSKLVVNKKSNASTEDITKKFSIDQEVEKSEKNDKQSSKYGRLWK